jgi:hypothetical protein
MGRASVGKYGHCEMLVFDILMDFSGVMQVLGMWFACCRKGKLSTSLALRLACSRRQRATQCESMHEIRERQRSLKLSQGRIVDIVKRARDIRPSVLSGLITEAIKHLNKGLSFFSVILSFTRRTYDLTTD